MARSGRAAVLEELEIERPQQTFLYRLIEQ
jgi:hypothetical protein